MYGIFEREGHGHMKNLNVKATDRILIISPHPDDESIACGGILCTYGMQCDVVSFNSRHQFPNQDA